MFRTEMKTENDKYFQLYYIKTYARIPPYLIGIILGWLIHNTRSTKIQMEKVRNDIQLRYRYIYNNNNIVEPY